MVAVPAAGQASVSDEPGEVTGTSAPPFVLETIDGDTFELDEHRGEVVVVNFWATWCAPCRYEIPAFVELQDEFRTRGVQFVGVALQHGAGSASVKQYAEHMDISYPVGVGDGSISEKYGGVQRLPTTVVIGPDGTIRGRIPGVVPKSMLRSSLERLLPDSS